MKILSICSGIEAASVALAGIPGWQVIAVAEIEPFPCWVLHHRQGASRPWFMPEPSATDSPQQQRERLAAIRAVASIPAAARIPNLGDLTRWREWPDDLLVQVELLVGGTPCQAFSVAGLRASLTDDRGNLTLIFCELYAHINRLRRAAGLPPALCLWENVPGVLSTHDNAFGCLLSGLAGEDVPLQPPGGRWTHAGYVSGPAAAVAWRTLDAQYFDLAQRRARVFALTSADPAFDPAAVLFEFDGLRRDTPPSREPGQGTAPTLSARTKGGGGLGTDAECDGAFRDDSAVTLGVCEPAPQARETPFPPCCAASETGAGFWTADGLGRLRGTTAPTQPQTIVAFGGNNQSGPLDIATARNACASASASGRLDFETETFLVLKDATPFEGSADTPVRPAEEDAPAAPFAFKASHFTRGKDGAPSDLAPPLSADADKGDQDTLIAFDTTQITSAANRSRPKAGDPCHPLASQAHPPAVAFRTSSNCGAWETGDKVDALTTGTDPTSHVIAFSGRMRGDDVRGYDRPPQVFGAEVVGTLDTVKPHCVAFQPRIARNGRGDMGDLVNALQAQSGQSGKGDAAPCVAIRTSQQSSNGRGWAEEGPAFTLDQANGQAVMDTAWRVRRLTPEECEILQGFPVGYTLIPAPGGRLRKNADLALTIAYLVSLDASADQAAELAHGPDGPRYKALGNSWATKVVRWIFQRIHNLTQ